ncbi:MAG: hypothetical protein WC326_15485 [Candidatus Delongbacteria bacterium]
MFDVTKDDVSALDDVTLRDLVGRLCEAELHQAGLPVSSVTYGGDQNAADGGLDVCVELASGSPGMGFIPRAFTGYQVKAQNMFKSDILDEMAPNGAPRQILRDLSDKRGAYLMVSSRSSLAFRALRERRQAMREAIASLLNHDQLLVEFYDQQRLATLIRQFPGLVAWVRSKVGRPLTGWQPYDSWSQPGRDAEARFLLDEAPRFNLQRVEDRKGTLTTLEGIHRVRSALVQPGHAVRLVGLSGVGKTRFAEALFDKRVGEDALPASLVAYTNLEEQPDPTPETLARTLIAERRRAILLLDNCGPDRHNRLVQICKQPDSCVSVLTIEYDVRGDEPEGTDVLIMRGLPSPMIEILIRQRHPEISEVNARTIADQSDGNSRIALALAEACKGERSLSVLAQRDLFNRLFWQGAAQQPDLHNAAKACALVYSFDGVTLEGEESELPQLAALAGQSTDELFGHVAALERKHLVQQRGGWRAVLPHALANQLAEEVLEEKPTARILQRLESQSSGRLFKSFTHRLSFLVSSRKAKEITAGWLEPEGRFGDVCALNHEQWDMLRNIAPVAPERALEALERAGGEALSMERHVASGSQDLLCKLAYDPEAFERACRLLIAMAAQEPDEGVQQKARTALESLFPIILSGTHASVEQRLSIVESLLGSAFEPLRRLGLETLRKVLKANHFSSHHSHSFGGQPRDFGYWPETNGEIDHWYGTTLALIERFAWTMPELRPELMSVLASRFRDLWTQTRIQDPLCALMLALAGDRFWRTGWAACRETLHHHGGSMEPGRLARLQELERSLRPSRLADQVRAMALGEWEAGLDLEGYEDIEMDVDARSAHRERQEEIVRRLSATVAVDPDSLAELLPEIMRGGMRIWVLGQGIATGAEDPHLMWALLADGFCAAPMEGRDARILCGFLDQLARHDRAVAHRLLEDALSRPLLAHSLALLHAAIGLDTIGVDRLISALESDLVDVKSYRDLAGGRATETVAEEDLSRLLLHIAEHPEGVEVGLDVLSMRSHVDRSAGRAFGPALRSCGLELLDRSDLLDGPSGIFNDTSGLAAMCLEGVDGAPGAVRLALHVRRDGHRHFLHSSDVDNLMRTLLRMHPLAVLDALFTGSDEELHVAARLLSPSHDHHPNPLSAVSCEDLLAWCAEDPARRFPIAGSLVPFAHRAEPSGPRTWTDTALALIRQAPNPEAVLLEFVQRFGSGNPSRSVAVDFESYCELLDLLPDLLPVSLAPAIEKGKATCQRHIDSLRRMEAEMDQDRSEERFE